MIITLRVVSSSAILMTALVIALNATAYAANAKGKLLTASAESYKIVAVNKDGSAAVAIVSGYFF